MISRMSRIFNKSNYINISNKFFFNLLISQLTSTSRNTIQFPIERFYSTLDDLRHDELRKKIYIVINDRTAYLRYKLNKNVMKVVTVYVPKELEGKGLGKLLSENNFRVYASSADLQHYYGSQFYLIVNGKKASLKYRLNSTKNVMTILSVYVPQELQGRGLGKILTEGAFKYVADNNLKMEILCVYAAHYLEKHAPQYKKYLI